MRAAFSLEEPQEIKAVGKQKERLYKPRLDKEN
jgi:hypothetical protein